MLFVQFLYWWEFLLFFVEKMLCDYYVDWKIKRFSKVCPDSTWSLTKFGIRHW